MDYPSHATGLDLVLSGYHASIGVYGHQVYEPRHLARARQVFESVGLRRLEDRPLGTFSTGKQRRCLLARVLVHDPEVLVFNEPTSGLDPQACFRYRDILRGLMAGGKTVLLVTHHLHEIPPKSPAWCC